MKTVLSRSTLLAAALLTGVHAGELTFEKTLLEVTAQPDQEQVTVDFAFTSTGDDAAVILRHDAPCSCLEAQISNNGQMVWEPGESGTVRGLFQVGSLRGTIDKQITLMMKDGQRHDLTVRMTLPEFLVIEPKTLKWEQGGEAESQSFEITVAEGQKMALTEVSATNPTKFPYELETLEEGRRYRITVTPSDLEKRGFGLLRLRTDSKFKKHQNYQAYVVVTKSFTGTDKAAVTQ
ncbi:DUF1573 domain-containing protein [Roseibacillus ishigakijimensis]|uniref:DUF1573 domain-containing protein n=1 Tax=Roseibacillus ishigakijimensis TaxID=454146 RepID=A0A934RME2_9BACT|nr:DUF1573 domain-containing protein [Roseibacillus ishigakijimensis]MBK1834059.1 DUF1573 domain-containing protein [Roseibacillus ishigakijimensis]